MKKAILFIALQLGAAACAVAQGTITSFGNLGLPGSVVYGGSFTPATGYVVALLWAPGSSLVAQGSLTQITTYGPAGTTATPGKFSDPSVVTTGTGTSNGAVAVFDVQGWVGNYANYAAAVAGGALVGQTAEFFNGTGNPTPPATPPVNMTSWDGNLILVPSPEPSTIALGGIGAAVFWIWRRKNEDR